VCGTHPVSSKRRPLSTEAQIAFRSNACGLFLRSAAPAVDIVSLLISACTGDHGRDGKAGIATTNIYHPRLSQQIQHVDGVNSLRAVTQTCWVSRLSRLKSILDRRARAGAGSPARGHCMGIPVGLVGQARIGLLRLWSAQYIIHRHHISGSLASGIFKSSSST
jgi:hypothetical protein